MFYNILGYILLPFYAIYKWVLNSYKEMNGGYKILFVYALFIAAMLTIDLIINI